MTGRSVYRVLGVTMGLATFVILFQNCSNKSNINLEEAIKHAQTATHASIATDPKEPITLSFSDSLNGRPIDVFSNGQTIFAHVYNAGTSGMVCSESNSDRVCLSNFPNASYWRDLYQTGWTEIPSEKKWVKQLTAGSDVAVGTHRFYFIRPKIEDPTKPNNYGSVEFQVQ